MKASEKDKLKFEKYVTLLEFKKSDLKYHTEEHQERKEIFHKDFNKFINSRGYSISEEKLSKNIIDVYEKQENVENPKLEKECSKMYKEIAKETHPDKNLHKDESVAEKRNKTFMEAKVAKEEHDWYTLYNHALDLGIEIPQITQEQIDWLQSEIDKIDAVIKKIEGTYTWLYCEPNANKQSLLTTYSMIVCNKIE